MCSFTRGPHGTRCRPRLLPREQPHSVEPLASPWKHADPWEHWSFDFSKPDWLLRSPVLYKSNLNFGACQSVPAPVTKCHRLVDKQQKFVSHGPGGVVQDRPSSWRSSRGTGGIPSQTPHVVELGGSSLGLFCKGANPFVRAPALEPHCLPRHAP